MATSSADKPLTGLLTGIDRARDNLRSDPFTFVYRVDYVVERLNGTQHPTDPDIDTSTPTTVLTSGLRPAIDLILDMHNQPGRYTSAPDQGILALETADILRKLAPVDSLASTHLTPAVRSRILLTIAAT